MTSSSFLKSARAARGRPQFATWCNRLVDSPQTPGVNCVPVPRNVCLRGSISDRPSNEKPVRTEEVLAGGGRPDPAGERGGHGGREESLTSTISRRATAVSAPLGVYPTWVSMPLVSEKGTTSESQHARHEAQTASSSSTSTMLAVFLLPWSACGLVRRRVLIWLRHTHKGRPDLAGTLLIAQETNHRRGLHLPRCSGSLALDS